MKAISTICIASWIAAAAAAQAPPVVEPKVKPKVPEERVRQHGDLISGTDHAEIAEQMKQDVLLRALVDELERGQSGLALQDLKRPYFIEFGLSDGQGARVAARLGAVISESSARSRRLRVDLRVGSYELDNTNFAGGFGGMGGGGGGSEAEIPIEDDYTAIRQALWWATDREYKQAVETFEQKEAFMESKVIENKPHDFAHQEPAVHFDERVNVSIEVRRLTELAREVSEVFLGFPEIKRSGVMLTAGGGQRYVVNSEGTRLRTSRRSCSIQIGASVQCDDGMEFSDTISVVAETIEDLPALEELAERCRAMAGQLLALRRAPKLDSYSGPVLFEPRAAAEIFAAQFARRFAGGQRPVGGRTEADDLEKKLGKRILP
jgi:hypothetical protein